MEDLAREDRERLERFLEWERATRRAARHRRRRHVSVAALVGVVLVTIVAAWLAHRTGDAPPGVATAPDRPSAEEGAVAGGAPPTAGESRPTAAVAAGTPPATESAPAPAGTEREPAATATDAASAARPQTVAPEAATAVAPPGVNVVTESPAAAGSETAGREPGSGARRQRVAAPATAPSRAATDVTRRVQSPPSVVPEPAQRRDVAKITPAPPAPGVSIPAQTPAPPVSAPTTVTPSVPERPATRTRPPAPAAPNPVAPSAATAVAPPPPASPAASRAPVPWQLEVEEGLETVKRWVGYIPEVRVGKAIARWVKSQPPADSLPRPADPIQTQTP